MKRKQNWSDKWGLHVLEELQRLNKNVENMSLSLHEFQVWTNREIASLKVKAGIWGLMGGGIPVLIALLAKSLSN